MGQKLKKHGLAKAEQTICGHIMNHHMVAGAEGAHHQVVRYGRIKQADYKI